MRGLIGKDERECEPQMPLRRAKVLESLPERKETLLDESFLSFSGSAEMKES